MIETNEVGQDSLRECLDRQQNGKSARGCTAMRCDFRCRTGHGGTGFESIRPFGSFLAGINFWGCFRVESRSAADCVVLISLARRALHTQRELEGLMTTVSRAQR